LTKYHHPHFAVGIIIVVRYSGLTLTGRLHFAMMKQASTVFSPLWTDRILALSGVAA